jgi:ceramide glucosyltransferase
VLAEDYIIGRDLVQRLGLEVAIARRPVWNVAVRRSVGSFFKRYLRWGVIHRTAVSLPTSLAQGLLNPWPLTLMALALSPSALTAWACALTLGAKTLIDLSSARRLGCPLSLACLPAVAIKDVLLFVTWAHGQVSRTVDWRGTRLRVTAGSVLLTTTPHLQPLEGAAS